MPETKKQLARRKCIESYSPGEGPVKLMFCLESSLRKDTDADLRAKYPSPPKTEREIDPLIKALPDTSSVKNQPDRAGMGDQLRALKRRNESKHDPMNPENLRLKKLARERMFKMDAYRRRNSKDPFIKNWQKGLDE